MVKYYLPRFRSERARAGRDSVKKVALSGVLSFCRLFFSPALIVARKSMISQKLHHKLQAEKRNETSIVCEGGTGEEGARFR